MAMMKYGAAAVVNPVVSPGKWIDKKVSPGRVKVAKQIIGQHNTSDWLLSHVTIMASVDCDYADPKDSKSNYLIKPEYGIFVNNNGDSWERSLLSATYKTFLTADNFVEHVQIPELSKGKILDVALREVPFAKDKEGRDLTTLYVDILIATNRKHADLIQKIESGEYSAVSMGCLIKYSQCSQCGNIAADETEACKHIKYYKGNHFFDKQGIKRVVAELCGRVEEPESCVFIDASWVRKPAFEGAVLRNIVDIKNDPNNQVSDRIQKAISTPSVVNEIQFAGSDLLAKAASEDMPLDVRKNSAEQAASLLLKEITAAEGDEAPAPDTADAPADEPAGDTGDLDAPVDDAAFPEAPEDSGTPDEEGGEGDLGDAGLGGDTPEKPEEPAIEEPADDATTKEVRDMFKKQILNDLRRELLKDEAKKKQDSRPAGLENDINESLVHDANTISSEKDMNRYVSKVLAKDAGDNDRLRNGIMILASLKDWSRFKRYGYSREDVLGILHYIDKKVASEPVESNMVRALSRVKLASNDLKSFFTEIIFETGHKPSKTAAKKLVSWAKILNSLEN